jgi:hypothetical protein
LLELVALGKRYDEGLAELFIDGHVFPVDLLFANDYVVLADAQDGPFPMLSEGLVTAMQTGKTMMLRFDLLAELPGQPASFDGEAVIELEGGGHPAIAAVRRCADDVDFSFLQEMLPKCVSRYEETEVQSLMYAVTSSAKGRRNKRRSPRSDASLPAGPSYDWNRSTALS